MTPPNIVIEPLLQRGTLCWQVRMGRRGLIFHHEHAARAFAAQLHMRLLWLQHTTEPDASMALPSQSHD